jgi:hypothetical protein
MSFGGASHWPFTRRPTSRSVLEDGLDDDVVDAGRQKWVSTL